MSRLRGTSSVLSFFVSPLDTNFTALLDCNAVRFGLSLNCFFLWVYIVTQRALREGKYFSYAKLRVKYNGDSYTLSVSYSFGQEGSLECFEVCQQVSKGATI